jgi:hypothetical protein
MSAIGRSFSKAWRSLLRRTYGDPMTIARRGQRMEPERRPALMDDYAGQWVAIRDGQVIAHSVSSRDVVRQLRAMGPAAKGAVLQRAATESEALSVGLG